MHQDPRGPAKRLADAITLLAVESSYISPAQRDRSLAFVQEAISLGFTSTNAEFATALRGGGDGSWLVSLAASLLDDVTSDVAMLPPSTSLAANRANLARTLLTFVPSGKWSAMTVRTPGSFLIAIDDGIPATLYFLAKLMIVRWIVRQEGDDEDADLESAGREIPIEILARLARCYFGSGQVADSFVLPTPVWVTERQLDIALGATLHAERFMVHHEVQHILQGHLDADSPSPTDTSSRLQAEQEIEADAGATACTLARFIGHPLEENEQFELVKALCGIRLAFEAQGLVENTYFPARPISHPSPADRYQSIKQVALETWIPERLLTMADDLTGTLVEIADLCRSQEPYPRPKQPLRDALRQFPHFPDNDDSTHWEFVDEVEEIARVLRLSIPQHLAALDRSAGGNTFDAQDATTQRAVVTATSEAHASVFEDPGARATIRQFGDRDPSDLNRSLHHYARLRFDSTWGARLLPRLLRPALKSVRAAIGTGSGVSALQLTRWVQMSVPDEAVLPGVALLQRLLRDPQAEKIIARIAAEDLTGMEHELQIEADIGDHSSAVPEWVYRRGRLGRYAKNMTGDLVGSAADQLEQWLLEADEAVWFFSVDRGAAFRDLYSRASKVASNYTDDRTEVGSDTVTAYLRLEVLVRPRHARLCEVSGNAAAGFRQMCGMLPAMCILSGEEHVLRLARHIALAGIAGGWLDGVGDVIALLRDRRTRKTDDLADALEDLMA
ncbi:hypothetical protein [uncultured Cellulomonas sp.]|uniref:hypothetical protein n=1 Tax=uncultured Cellulomonas sp. TaxID=189682 RepID=UPI0028EB637B|nr:hypothetical protein [uncultured Cellulomonas sp.]